MSEKMEKLLTTREVADKRQSTSVPPSTRRYPRSPLIRNRWFFREFRVFLRMRHGRIRTSRGALIMPQRPSTQPSCQGGQPCKFQTYGIDANTAKHPNRTSRISFRQRRVASSKLAARPSSRVASSGSRGDALSSCDASPGSHSIVKARYIISFGITTDAMSGSNQQRRFLGSFGLRPIVAYLAHPGGTRTGSMTSRGVNKSFAISI